MSSDQPPVDRYLRQSLFIGAAAQERLGRATAVVVGCGALGSMSAMLLARAGVGRLRLVDRDYVDRINLHRQILYTEQDARHALPKAVAAAAHLAECNSEIALEPHVADFTPGTAAALCAGADVIVDGLDNFEGRFLLNDVAVKLGVPWVYGGAVAAYGLTMTILPGVGPCLRCIYEEAPPPGTSPTCDTIGILAPIATTVASLQAAEALKIAGGLTARVSRHLLSLDLWQGGVQEVAVARTPGCPCCDARRFDYLEGARASHADALCGRNAVQLAPAAGGAIDLAALAARLGAAGAAVTQNAYLVRARLDGHELTVFADGRAIVAGTPDPAVARGVYAKYVGA
ncbi:MAG TPA: ThiF family adenylyltransferase [Polyangia bacterium]|jgi:adenylyltransferase/sulfurtransferase